MTTEADIGHGILVQRNDGDSPNDWETLGELRDISGPSISKETPDASHTTSPKRFREFISGMIDGGEVSMTLAFIPGGTTMASLFADLKSKAAIEYRVLFPDGTGSTPENLAYDTAWRFDCHVNNLSPAMPLTDSMTVEVSLKITGEPLLESTE